MPPSAPLRLDVHRPIPTPPPTSTTLDQSARDYLDTLNPNASPPPVNPDRPRWPWLHAQLGEHDASYELRDALYFLQTMGATFEAADRSMRMVPGIYPGPIYETIQDEILAKHAPTLVPILKRTRMN